MSEFRMKVEIIDTDTGNVSETTYVLDKEYLSSIKALEMNIPLVLKMRFNSMVNDCVFKALGDGSHG